jgi:cobalt-zinc-cadmium efflux system outer membrane protein
VILSTLKNRGTAPLLLLFGLVLTTSGCISSDPTSDRSTVDALVRPRLGESIDLEALQASPVSPPSVWNGLTPLDADAAVRVAFQRDAGIRVSLAELDLARAELAQADLPPNPALDLAIGVAVDGASGAPAIVGITQQLTWIWTRPDRVDARDADRRAMILLAAEAMIRLDAEVRRVHAAAIAAEATHLLDQAHAQATGRTVDAVTRLFEAGEASRIDLDRARLNAAESAATADASRRTARQMKLEVLAGIGCPDASTDFDLRGSLADSGGSVPDEDRIVELTRATRLDVAAARMRVLAAEAECRLAGSKRFPEVGVGAAWNQNFGDRQAVLPGARITLPILDDGSAAIAAANARLDRARLELLSIRRRAVGEVRSSREAFLRSDQQRIAYSETVLAPATEAETLAESAYRKGVIDLTVLLLAQQQRITAERRLVKFQVTAITDRISLQEQVGGSFDLSPLPPVVPDIDQATTTTDPTKTAVRSSSRGPEIQS